MHLARRIRYGGMNEESQLRYLLAKPIALAALDLGIIEREAYVVTACSSDGALLDEVRWMLRAAEVSTESISRSPFPETVARDPVGTTLLSTGNSCYRTVRRLGEGGMGVVHLAERVLDEGGAGEVRQSVALKLLNTPGMPGDELLRRFAEERRILAKLSHRNIAHLIDGGTMFDGRPFLAMEYVEGERVDEWCDRRQLSLRERVELFVQVCSVVDYAHGQRVIHRDIKPENILVTAEGEPKLLDFGIARLMDTVDGTAERKTGTAHRALTLAYASPEQVRGQALGPATDVWSLGVLLYKLVCGVLPFDVGDGSALDLSNAIVIGKMAPPSRQKGRTHPFARKLPEAIDAIVLRALQSDPAERYARVGQMIVDLRRFLASRPLYQGRGILRYRAQAMTRLRWSWIGMGVTLLAVLGGILVLRAALLRTMQQQSHNTEAMAGLAREMFENGDPELVTWNPSLTMRETVDHDVARSNPHPRPAPPQPPLVLSLIRSHPPTDIDDRATSLKAAGLAAQGGTDAPHRGRLMAALACTYAKSVNMPLSGDADSAPVTPDQAALRARIAGLYNHIGALDMPLRIIDAGLRDALATIRSGMPVNTVLEAQALSALGLAKAAAGDDEDAGAAEHEALDMVGNCTREQGATAEITGSRPAADADAEATKPRADWKGSPASESARRMTY